MTGAADFLPDFIQDEALKSPASPKYADFYTILVKVNQWLEKVKVSRHIGKRIVESPLDAVNQLNRL